LNIFFFRKYVEGIHYLLLKAPEEHSSEIQVSLKSDKNKYTLHEDQYTFLVMSRSVLLRMGNVSGKIVGEKSKRTYDVQ